MLDTTGMTWWSILGHEEYQRASIEDKARLLLSLRSPNDQRFLSKFMESGTLQLLSAHQTSKTTVNASYKFPVDIYYGNGSDNLHGGAQAAIYDMLTSITLQLICTPDFWIGAGVSRTLNVSYLRPAPVGIDVICEVEVVATGKTLGLQRATMKRASDGALISTCEHHKAAVPVPVKVTSKL